MGADPISKLAIGQAGSAALTPLFAPEGTDVRSFADTDVDPANQRFVRPQDLLVQANRGIFNLGEFVAQQLGTGGAFQPRTSAVIQQPSTITGGGLPLAFGNTASDPALDNPNLLTRPGLDFGHLAPFAGATPPDQGPMGPPTMPPMQPRDPGEPRVPPNIPPNIPTQPPARTTDFTPNLPPRDRPETRPGASVQAPQLSPFLQALLPQPDGTLSPTTQAAIRLAQRQRPRGNLNLGRGII